MKTIITFYVFAIFISVLIISGLFLNRNIYSNQFNPGHSQYPGSIMLNPASVLSESFEGLTFPPSGWIKITPSGGTGWYREVSGTYPVPGLSIGYVICPSGGGTALAFCNYLTGSHPQGQGSSNQWLITPRLGNIQSGDSISFWLRKLGHYLDHFQIMISVTTPTIEAMTTIVDTLTFYPSDSGYVFRKYNIGSLVPNGSNIYVGFREWVADASHDGATFSLDLVKSTAQIVEIKNISEAPADYSLSQNYPNPFNPSTAINYSIAKKGFVSLIVYDLLGREVSILERGIKNAGNYFVIFNANKLPGGVYFYKLQSGKFSGTKKLILIK
jgi:hypothetical protein